MIIEDCKFTGAPDGFSLKIEVLIIIKHFLCALTDETGYCMRYLGVAASGLLLLPSKKEWQAR